MEVFLEMPYPDFIDMVQYYSDPEEYVKKSDINPTGDVDVDKERILEGLEKLRSTKKE